VTFAIILGVILAWPIFPSPLATEPVWAALRQTGRYLVSVTLVGAMILLWRQREGFAPAVVRLLLAAIVLALGSDVALTFLAEGSGHAILVGHLLKILSVYLIYKTLIATEIVKPYQRLFRTMQLSGEIVRQEKDFANRLMEMAQVIVLVLDAEGRIIRFNRVCEAVSGYTLSEVKNQPFWEVFPAPEEVDEAQEAFFDLIAGDFSQSWKIDWMAQDGTRHLIAWSNTAFIKDNGTVEYVIGTGIDITAQREVEQGLHRLNGKLQEQIQEKLDFFPDATAEERQKPAGDDAVCRDLKVPIRWLNGYCRALAEHAAPRLDLKGKAYLARLHRLIQQLGWHLDAHLDQHKIDRAELRPQTVDLSLQARVLARDLKRAAPARRLEFAIANGLTAPGDPAMLRAVLENLIGNAWKFTEGVSDGRIEFGALPPQNGFRGFFIRDNRTDFGINYVNKLFRSLQRWQAIQDFSGTDIGLATARQVILRHGGRLWAEGELGCGVTFYFTLPDTQPEPGDKPV
jgi:PAS domain S-box-containing protein